MHAPSRHAFEAPQLSLIGDREARAGTVRERDLAIAHWLGRLGAASLDHLRVHFGLGRTVAYRRTAALSALGLVERIATLPGEPALLRTTRKGLRFCDLPLGLAVIRVEHVRHWFATATVAVALEAEFAPPNVVSEREIRFGEQCADRPLASARVRRGGSGLDGLHRPDLAVLVAEEVIAIEVELSAKAPSRLDAILRAWRRAQGVRGVRYYSIPGPAARAVLRAIQRTGVGETVEVRNLPELRRT